MNGNFRLQDSWLGCNGIVGLALAILSLVLVVLAAIVKLALARAGSSEA